MRDMVAAMEDPLQRGSCFRNVSSDMFFCFVLLQKRDELVHRGFCLCQVTTILGRFSLHGVTVFGLTVDFRVRVLVFVFGSWTSHIVSRPFSGTVCPRRVLELLFSCRGRR